ncbi:MAG: topoisomerase subunit [Bacteriovoracaceae bacterium]|nr:topoisomerase subunit [Bacteriovoracaceae bacterium]
MGKRKVVQKEVLTEEKTSVKEKGKALKVAPEPRMKAHKKKGPAENAESLAKKQREISVSEFFAKNRHLLGFDNPKKALLTAVKEAIDNSLDACEESEILPEITVKLVRLSAKVVEPTPEEEAALAKGGKPKKKNPTPTEKYCLTVIDNGPGIVPAQIPKIFAKLLYGSKFHRLKMSRGQQGIGIAAAGMYGQMTTGKPMRVYSKLPKNPKATFVELQIDTKTNKPDVLQEKEVAWTEKTSSGTIVEITLEGRYQRGRQSIDEFVLLNTLSNPHASFKFVDPDGEIFDYPRKIEELPPLPSEIKPHPYGVELGRFHQMVADTSQKTMRQFLTKEFSRVSDKVVDEIFKEAGVKDFSLASAQSDKVTSVHEAIKKVPIMNPPTDCIVPIGEELLTETLRNQTKAEFYTAITRPPSVYRGNPFVVECALAFGGELRGDEAMTVFRFANRVPLQFQPAACATLRVITKADWKNYGLNQQKNSLPVGPVAVVIHVASVWVPFTSESKEAIADYPEIKQEIRLAVLECARRLSVHVSRGRRADEAERKANYIDTYIPFIGEALQAMLTLSDKERDKVVATLRDTLEKGKLDG